MTQFNFGVYYRMYLKFPEEGEWFVPNNTEWIIYASPKRNYFPTWQNINKLIPGSRILNFDVTHDEARRLNTLTGNYN